MPVTKKTVLLVDDELDICDFLSEYLQDRQITSYYATDIEGALAIACDHRIDIVFLDNNLLNQVNGVDYIPRFREINPQCKIYMLTANTTPEIKNRAERYGADGFIAKPFEFAVFDRIIMGLRA